jgi:hypothetical protein
MEKLYKSIVIGLQATNTELEKVRWNKFQKIILSK